MKIYIYRFKDIQILEWWMLNKNYGYFRRIKVTQEHRFFDRDEEIKNEFGFKLRRCRNKANTNAWDLERTSSRISMKSWKALFKGRKQYEKNYRLRKVVIEEFNS